MKLLNSRRILIFLQTFDLWKYSNFNFISQKQLLQDFRVSLKTSGEMNFWLFSHLIRRVLNFWTNQNRTFKQRSYVFKNIRCTTCTDHIVRKNSGILFYFSLTIRMPEYVVKLYWAYLLYFSLIWVLDSTSRISCHEKILGWSDHELALCNINHVFYE